MPRATPRKTKYPRVYKRDTTRKGRVYDFYVLVDGEQVWTRGDHANLEQAEAHRKQLQYQADHGMLPTAKPRTLAAFVEEDWLPHQEARVARGKLKDSTLYQYRSDVNGRILSDLGEERLDRIDLPRLRRYLDSLTAQGYSNHTVLRIINTVSGILEMARREKLILVNPVADLEKPSPASRTVAPYAFVAASTWAQARAGGRSPWPTFTASGITRSRRTTAASYSSPPSRGCAKASCSRSRG